MAHTNVKSEWVDGNLVFYDKDRNIILTFDGTNRKVTFPSGSALQLPPSTLGVGYIPLPLGSWRLIESNDIPAIAVASGNGGNLGRDTAPLLERVNAATDKQQRIRYVASGVVEITQQFAYPPDLDDTADVVVNILANMAGATDTPLLGVNYFEGVGDANAGGNTSALSATLTQKTVTIAASNIGAYPKAATVGIIPAAHGTDALHIYATWITYTRKTT
jgi:hypothetical protein